MAAVFWRLLAAASGFTLPAMIWRASDPKNSRMRAVLFGWAASAGLAVVWRLFLPAVLRKIAPSLVSAGDFPDGTLLAAALFGGWLLPLLLVDFRRFRQDGGGGTGRG